MSREKPFDWVPLGVLAAVVLSLAVAWAFRVRLGRAVECETLYAQAATAADSARIDTLVVVPAGADPAVTCADLRGAERGR